MSDSYTEFQQHSGINWTNGERTVGVANYDSRMNVFFFSQAVLNPIKSKEVGREFKETKDFVRIAPPGEKLNIVVREVTNVDKQKYPQQWALYCQNKEQIPDGTPIGLLWPGDPAIAENLKAWGFHTVEQLAHASADSESNIMGMRTYINKAVAYLEQAQKGVSFHKYQKDFEEKDRQIKVLGQQLQMAMQEIANLRSAFQNVGMIQAQAVQAGASITRPTYPQQMQNFNMPQAAPGMIPTQQQPGIMPPMVTPLAPAFDAQTAQINSVQAQTARRGRPPGSKNKPKTEGADAPPMRTPAKLEPPSI